MAIGSLANSSAEFAIALGTEATAEAPRSIALGYQVYAPETGFFVAPVRSNTATAPCLLTYNQTSYEVQFDCTLRRRMLAKEEENAQVDVESLKAEYEAKIAALEARFKSLEEKVDVLLR